jgi:peptide methionine sulfoxide reductase MsrA
MNKYRDWTIAYYAGQIPERVYSAERRDRNSGVTTTLYAPSRVAIERAVDTFIQQHDPCQAEPIELGI